MGELYAKMAADLDEHPKIVAGGREAREVFLFVLRKNWRAGKPLGWIPAPYLEPAYVARALFMTPAEAAFGIERAIAVKLIAVTCNGETLQAGDAVSPEGVVEIVGWSEEWGWTPKSSNERVKKHRELRKLSKEHERNADETVKRYTALHETPVNGETTIEVEVEGEVQGSDQDPPDKSGGVSRGPKGIKVDRIPDAAWQIADSLRRLVLHDDPKAAISRAKWTEGERDGSGGAREGLRAKWAEVARLILTRDKREVAEVGRVLRWLRDQPPGQYRFVVQSPAALREKWDRITAQMRAKAAPARSASVLDIVDATVAEITGGAE